MPTQDPKYKTTVRMADQTVHGRLAKSRLAALLETVRGIGFGEIVRMRRAVGDGGRVVSLHTLMYRLGYNVNCIGIFGPRLDHVATRITLQNFTEAGSLVGFACAVPAGRDRMWLTSRDSTNTCFSTLSTGPFLCG